MPPDIGLMYCVSPGRGPGPCRVLPRDRLLQRKNANAISAAKTATPAIVPPTMAPVRLTPPLVVPLVAGASVPVGEEVDELEEVVDDESVVCDAVDENDAAEVTELEWLDVLVGDDMVSVDVTDSDEDVSVLEVLLVAVGDSVEADAVNDTVTLSNVSSEVRPVALLATVPARSLAVPQPY